MKLIEIMKQRGNRAYKHKDPHLVIAKVSALPEPPEIVRLLPLDKFQDKIEVQKSAASVPTPASVEEACALLETKQMIAVAHGKSCQDELDTHAQQNAVLQSLMDKLQTEYRH